MELGLGQLGLAPHVFWSMTPRELDAAFRGRLGPAQRPEPPSLAELTAMMTRFPDVQE